jgi:hypothetical protein
MASLPIPRVFGSTHWCQWSEWPRGHWPHSRPSEAVIQALQELRNPVQNPAAGRGQHLVPARPWPVLLSQGAYGSASLQSGPAPWLDIGQEWEPQRGRAARQLSMAQEVGGWSAAVMNGSNSITMTGEAVTHREGFPPLWQDSGLLAWCRQGLWTGA